MSINANALASAVFADHISKYPDAITAFRENQDTGVPRHLPSEAFIGALCDAMATILPNIVILDIGAGFAGAGASAPVSFALPTIPLAEQTFLASEGWTGDEGHGVASIFIGSVLKAVQNQVRLQMDQSIYIGAGVVSPVSNPLLAAQVSAALSTALPNSFQATGKFGQDDVPSNPVNETLSSQLNSYAQAFGVGMAGIIASTTYTGTPAAPIPAPVPTTGGFV